MQSENGILLLFYIFLSHGNEEEKNEKRGGCCVLSTSTCGQIERKLYRCKTDSHNKTEMLLKVALNTITVTLYFEQKLTELICIIP
jgi:hypothetical protein